MPLLYLHASIGIGVKSGAFRKIGVRGFYAGSPSWSTCGSVRVFIYSFVIVASTVVCCSIACRFWPCSSSSVVFDLAFRVTVFKTWSALCGSFETTMCKWVHMGFCSELLRHSLNPHDVFRRSGCPCHWGGRDACCPVDSPLVLFLLVAVLGLSVYRAPSIHSSGCFIFDSQAQWFFGGCA